MNGRPADITQIFSRPAGTDPKRLKLFAETSVIGPGCIP